MQIFNLQTRTSQFVELYYTGDLALNEDGTKAYVEQRSVIIPIDLATATAGPAIEVSPDSSGQTIILKDIVASYELQNAGALVNP